MRRPLPLLALLLAPLVACDDDTPAEPTDAAPPPTADATPPDAASPGAVTWHQHVAPIVMRECAPCHVDGGVAPFPLDSYQTTAPMAGIMLSAVEAGRMPPWMPDPDCRDYQDPRLLTAAEIDTLRAWADTDTLEGDPATAAPIDLPERRELDATHTARPIEPYTPPAELADDYRCFILDLEFPADTFLTGSEVVPDASAIVHHVLVYALEPEQVDGAFTADAESAVPGYPCYGGPLPGETGDILAAGTRGIPSQIGAWVPGSNPSILPDDHAIPVRAGSRIVMQVHYNLQSAPAEPDATTIDLRLTDTPPAFIFATRPLFVRTLDIPAGEAEARNMWRFEHYGDTPLTLTSAGPHMHQLGRTLTSLVERADGDTECLIDIPDYRFEWQQEFVIPRDDWITVHPGDAITLECVFDNTPQNQPIVDGRRIEPRDVEWGEGTLDEMCMVFLGFSQPYAPPPPPSETLCRPSATACVAECAGPDRSTADCVVACGERPECTLCALQQTPDCGGVTCAPALLALRDAECMQRCLINTQMLGGNPSTCLRAECPDTYHAVTDCLGDVLDTGACDALIADTCGLTLP